MQETTKPPTPHLAAAALLGVKAVLGLWAAIVALTASATQPHTFLGQAVRRRAGGLGVLLLVLVAVTVAVVVGLVQGASWAPVVTYVLEGVSVLLALTRIDTRPRAAFLAIVLSAAIIVLVVVGSSPRRTAAT